MQSPQTWRELLQIIIKKPAEKERLTRAIGVDSQTFMRWIKRDEIPSSHQLYLLLDEVPQHRAMLRALILEEIDDFSDGIAPAFPAHILDLYNTAPDEARFWSICSAVFAEALQHLDKDQQGLSLSAVQCMGRDDTVYCLRESVALGTYPWNERIEQRTRFLGAESLAGYAISTGSIQVIGDSRQEAGPVANLPEYALSAAAIPILYTNRVAGCLLIASTQRNYFRSLTSVNLIKEYVSLLTLAFQSDEFYALEKIALRPMPPFQEQQPYLSTLRQRIQATWKTAFTAQHTMSYPEVQKYVWWQIAEELLHLSS